jgi:hypothetical protein
MRSEVRREVSFFIVEKDHSKLIRARRLNAGLLAGSQFESGRSCDRPRSRFCVVFLGPRADAELVPKFHDALHASHAALPMVTLKISPCTK